MTFDAAVLNSSARHFRGEPMRLVVSAAFASLTLAAPAVAADLFGSAPPMSFPASQAPTAIETGTNWYVRGDVGVGFDDAPSIVLPTLSSLPPGYLGSSASSSGSGAGFAGDLGFGYRINDFVRLDATWDYWTSPSRTRSFAVICPYGLVGVANPATGAPAGYLYDPTNACAGTTSLSQHNDTFLANGYVDLGTYGGFTPYVGGGVGLNVSFLQGSASFLETANGLGYAANLTSNGAFPSLWVNSAGQPITPQPGIPFTAQNWNRTINSTTYRVAWALAVGFGFQLTPSATLDVGYRYLNAGQANLLVNPQTGLAVKQNNASQQILIGVRYLLQ
jgi:opacity protein-like surface antigen